ncbi:CLUMA_CG005831, isoform A [Clunio marinus]|uniref:CLUMA_CG005831, isoform A n=1 Tax=Clunio marinus TaxID=568069 RepID=A0A1J1HXT1_9DIPT|nr:CLUMA_CG005831, isoform A [Clunio marinus]
MKKCSGFNKVATPQYKRLFLSIRKYSSTTNILESFGSEAEAEAGSLEKLIFLGSRSGSLEAFSEFGKPKRKLFAKNR